MEHTIQELVDYVVFRSDFAVLRNASGDVEYMEFRNGWVWFLIDPCDGISVLLNGKVLESRKICLLNFLVTMDEMRKSAGEGAWDCNDIRTAGRVRFFVPTGTEPRT